MNTQAAPDQSHLAVGYEDFLKRTTQDSDDRYGVSIAPAATALWETLRTLDLLENIAELEIKGLTVIAPDKVASPEFIERINNAIDRVARQRYPDRDNVAKGAFGEVLPYMLFEDDVFQEAVLNPVVLALTTYLVGENSFLFNCMAVIKRAGSSDLYLHCDHAMHSAPFAPHVNICNLTMALSEYSQENGALCYVPGSHRYYRHPMPGEGVDQRVVVNAAPGSLIVWSGNTWHGAFQRTAPGTRKSLIIGMARPFVRPQELYKEHVTPELLDKHPTRFRKLMGQHIGWGWKEEGLTNPNTLDVGRHVYD